MDVDADSATALEMEVQLFGLSFYYAAVEMATQALATMVVAAITAVSGLSFFSSSAAADVVETTDVSNIISKMATESSAASFFIIIFEWSIIFISQIFIQTTFF